MGEDVTPPELWLAWQIDRWGTEAVLGREAQSIRLLNTMSVLKAAYGVVRRLRSARGEKIHDLSESDREMIAWFREEGWL